jgi:hypothetical protein
VKACLRCGDPACSLQAVAAEIDRPPSDDARPEAESANGFLPSSIGTLHHQVEHRKDLSLRMRAFRVGFGLGIAVGMLYSLLLLLELWSTQGVSVGECLLGFVTFGFLLLAAIRWRRNIRGVILCGLVGGTVGVLLWMIPFLRPFITILGELAAAFVGVMFLGAVSGTFFAACAGAIEPWYYDHQRKLTRAKLARLREPRRAHAPWMHDTATGDEAPKSTEIRNPGGPPKSKGKSRRRRGDE